MEWASNFPQLQGIDSLKFSIERFVLDIDNGKCAYIIDPQIQPGSANFTFKLSQQFINPLEGVQHNLSMVHEITVTLLCYGMDIHMYGTIAIEKHDISLESIK